MERVKVQNEKEKSDDDSEKAKRGKEIMKIDKVIIT